MTRYRHGREMPEEWLCTAEAALIAKRHQRTIVNWIHNGDLPAMKMPGDKGPYLIGRVDLMETIKRKMTPKPYSPKEQHDS